MMGSKYLPSVVYRARMLTFSTDNIEDTIPSISGIGISPEGDSDGSEEGERAGAKGTAEDAFNRGRRRIDEAKKKSNDYDEEESEDDPFEKSRNRAKPPLS